MQNACFQVPKVTATGYYNIENPLPDLISTLRRFLGAAKNAVCWLSNATGSQNG